MFDVNTVFGELYPIFFFVQLFSGDDCGNLRNPLEMQRLHSWDLGLLENCVREVNQELLNSKVVPRERLAACDLLAWILQPDPEDRPSSADHILQHPFFSNQSDTSNEWHWRMSPAHVAAALGDIEQFHALCDDAEYGNEDQIILSRDHLLLKSPLHLAVEEIRDVFLEDLVVRFPNFIPPEDCNGRRPMHSLLRLIESGTSVGDQDWVKQCLRVCRILSVNYSDDVDDQGRSAIDLGCSSPEEAVRNFFIQIRSSNQEKRRCELFRRIFCGDSLPPFSLSSGQLKQWWLEQVDEMASKKPKNAEAARMLIRALPEDVDGVALLSQFVHTEDIKGVPAIRLNEKKLTALLPKNSKIMKGRFAFFRNSFVDYRMTYYKSVLLAVRCVEWR